MKTVIGIVGILLAAWPAATALPADEAVAARFGLQPVAQLPAAPDLEDYLGYALTHNDGLAAARAAARAVAARADATGALPEPRFTWSEAMEPVETRVGPQERILSVTQRFPWFGTLGLERGVAADLAAGVAARTEAAALAVLRETRTVYSELVYLDRALATAAGHLELLVQVEAAARTRYETGEGAYADVVKSQVEMARLEDRLLGLRDLRRPLSARLNAVLGRTGSVPATSVVVGADPRDLDPSALRDRMLATNPDLAALARETDSQRKVRNLAGKRRYPDLSLGIRYIQVGRARNGDVPRSGRDAVFATLGLSLPLWRGRYGAGERAAEGSYRAAGHRRSDLARRLDARLEQAVYEHRDADRRVALYRDTLLPKARQSLAAARAAYESGTAAFLDLVDAERVLLEFELAFWRAEADRAIGLAAVEELVAGPVGPHDDREEDNHEN